MSGKAEESEKVLRKYMVKFRSIFCKEIVFLKIIYLQAEAGGISRRLPAWFSDISRHTLGAWGRLLNLMATTGLRGVGGVSRQAERPRRRGLPSSGRENKGGRGLRGVRLGFLSSLTRGREAARQRGEQSRSSRDAAAFAISAVKSKGGRPSCRWCFS